MKKARENFADICNRVRLYKKIWSELYQALELAKREELSLEDAWIYKKEDNVYKLIHKP